MKTCRSIRASDYTQQFFHGKRADYCVYGNGTVTRTWRKSWIEEIVTPYLSKGKLTVKCGGKEFIVKHLVAQAFLPDYQKGLSVVCVDGNEKNCDMENLCVINKTALGRITGGKTRKAKKIYVRNIETNEHFTADSVRAAAKKMSCSYQTLLDYIAGKVKKSVLSNYEVRVL